MASDERKFMSDFDLMFKVVMLTVGVTAIITLLCFGPYTDRHWRQDIVRHGCAEMVISDSITGSTKFVWKDSLK